MEQSSLKKIQKQIESLKPATQKNVQIIAVSKKQSIEKIRTLFFEGQRLFAENYVQEALKKQKELNDLKIEWHFIGHLQSNKVKSIVGHFELIHSIDSVKLIETINKVAKEKQLIQKILLQVNFSKETTKEGFDEPEVLPVLRNIKKYPHIQVLGLMTMPPLVDTPEENRIYFQKAAKLLRQTNLDVLSMGTSHDFSAAIQEGATYIRLGTILFGEREKN